MEPEGQIENRLTGRRVERSQRGSIRVDPPCSGLAQACRLCAPGRVSQERVMARCNTVQAADAQTVMPPPTSITVPLM